MRTKLILLTLFTSLFLAACSDDDDDFTPQLPETETALINTISKEWEISGAQGDIKSIEFTANKTFTVVKSDNSTVKGSYTIGSDLKTLTLNNFGIVTLTNLTSDKLDFKLKPNGSDTEIAIAASPAPTKPIVPKTYISEVQREFKSGVKPIVKFTYDANGRLSEAEEYEYNVDDQVNYTYKYVFERNADGTVKTVVSTDKHRNDAWVNRSTLSFTYQNGNIARIDEQDADGDVDIYRYIWQNGKIVKVEQDYDDDMAVFNYTNGNHTGYESNSIREFDYEIIEYDEKVINTYDNKQSFYNYLPFEYILAADPDDLAQGYPLSDNNLVRSEDVSKNLTKNKETGKDISQTTYTTIIELAYTFDDKGMVSGYTEKEIYQSAYIDFADPANNSSFNDETEHNYKIKYISVDQK